MKKRIITVLLCLILTVTFTIKPKQDADAFAFSIGVGSVIALVGVSLAGAGLVWHNRNDIIDVGQRVYDEVIKGGIDKLNALFTVGALVGGAKAIKFTKDGIDTVTKCLNDSRSSTDISSSIYYTDVTSVDLSNVYLRGRTYNFTNGACVTFQNSKTGNALVAYDVLKIYPNYDYDLSGMWQAETRNGTTGDRSTSLDIVSSVSLNDGSICVNPPSVSLKKWIGSISADSAIVVQPGKEVSAVGEEKDVYIPSVDGVTAKDDILGGVVSDIPKVGEDVISIPGVIGADEVVSIPNEGDISIPTTPDMSLPNKVALDFSPLYINLTNKFPFCIPFDLINCIKSFKANREVPNFRVDLDEGLVGKASFDLDFNKFNSIAAILRYFLLISFVACLIKITRSLIKG